jgi:LysM repeat protein
MGQLEKYGLYVLCLVIFLILGVTIWGEPASALKKEGRESVAIRANALGIDANGGAAAARVRTATLARIGALPSGPANANRLLVNAGNAGGDQGLMDSWLRPGARPPQPGKTPAAPAGAGKPAAGPTSGGPAGGEKVTTPVKPKRAATRTYKVRKGDTLGAIAQKQLGSTSYVGAIEKLNPGLDVDRLSIGKMIVLPGSAASSSAPASLSGSYRTYTISKGDSFERIARIELGSARRVSEVMRLNPNVDPRRLRLGKKIKLPRK